MATRNTPDELQLYFEIAMSIGTSDQLNEMLTHSLLAYLRKLNLSAGLVFQQEKTHGGKYHMNLVHKLPFNAQHNAGYKRVIAEIPEQFTKKKLSAYINQLPIVSELIDGTSYVIMELPNFGLLVLIKNAKLISTKIITSLKSVNVKLAKAAISCTQNQQIVDSEKKYRELIELLPELICETDLTGRVIFANKFAIDKFGYTPGDLEKDFSAFNLFVPEDRVRAKNKFAESTSKLSHVPGEYTAIKKDGSIFPVLVYTNKIMDNDKVVGMRGVMVDITERKAQEEKMHYNAERLEMALMGSGAGLWDWDISTGYIFRSDGWSKMLGYSNEEINSSVNSWENIIHPEDIDGVMKKLNDHLEGDTQLYRAEYRIKKKRGDWLWILDTGKVTRRDELGKALRVVGTQIDISERKRAEVKLASQHELLEHTLRQQEIISRISLNFNTLDHFDKQINEAIRLIGEHVEVSRVYIFEDNEDQTITRNTYEWCNQGVEPQINKLGDISYDSIPSWRKILESEGRIYSDNIFDLPDDIVAILEPQDILAIVFYPLQIKGNTIGFIGFDECKAARYWKKSELDLLKTTASIISNAYERERINKSFQESESQNKAILESIPDILFHLRSDGLILNYKGPGSDKKSMANKDIIQKNIADIFPEKSASALMAGIKTCLKKGHCRIDYAVEKNNYSKDFEAELARMNDKEVIVISRDVSDRKAYERELNAAKTKAEQANEAKNEFLANMSHEIRTPMNAILGFSESLNHAITDPGQKNMLESILSSGKLLLSIINDILDMAKIEAGRIKIENSPVNIKYLVSSVCNLFDDQAKNKGLSLKTTISDDLPYQILLDQRHVRQVLVNLIGNAIKFTEKGFVAINVEYRVINKRKQLIIDVEDSGPGISKENQEQIFQAFHQEYGEFNRKYGGTGLGLTIVQKMMNKMNGTVGLRSIPGKGSKFSLTFNDVETLEIKDESHVNRAESELEDMPAVVYHNATLLIVDDVKLNIETIKAQVADSGITILEAESGEIALEILKNTKPDLILMDIRMPGMSGFELAQRIKGIPHYANTPLIAFTASVFGDKEVLFRKTKLFNDVIYKPVSQSNLSTTLQKFLSYEVVGEKKKDEAGQLDVKLTVEALTKAPKLAHVLKGSYLENWKLIKDKLEINKIESFVNKLETEANKYHMPLLLNYSARIKQDLDRFDLAAVEKNLKEFPRLIHTIENLN